MDIKRIKWENGLKLDSEILSTSDTLNLKSSELANFLPFNLSKGIVSFVINEESLQTGLILVKKLIIYIKDKKFISYDNSYPLSLQIMDNEIAARIPIYLNVNEKIIEKDHTKYITEVLSLSTEYDHTATYSTMITYFRQNETSLEPLESEFPLLSMDHYLMDIVFTNLNKLISKVEVFNKFIFSTTFPHASIFLNFLLSKLKRELFFAESNKSNISPYHIFSLVHDVYSLIIENNIEKQNATTTFQYDFNKAYSSFNGLMNELEKVCEKKSIKNFVQFNRHGQKYVCENFPQEFFTANKYYLVVKKKSEAGTTNQLDKEIKITSISRYTKTVVLSLSGLKLKKIDASMHKNLHISLGGSDTTFEIERNSEWDFILVDKSATFTAFDGSENYDFFIAFV
ncbi:iglD3, intracellular growth locus, subunit D [Francisella sp. W12-1067]|nr:iglD3, intracellular growth locus, subunit D [Francisella sp. W12-1067]